jgi:hypothetical protein
VLKAVKGQPMSNDVSLPKLFSFDIPRWRLVFSFVSTTVSLAAFLWISSKTTAFFAAHSSDDSILQRINVPELGAAHFIILVLAGVATSALWAAWHVRELSITEYGLDIRRWIGLRGVIPWDQVESIELLCRNEYVLSIFIYPKIGTSPNFDRSPLIIKNDGDLAAISELILSHIPNETIVKRAVDFSGRPIWWRLRNQTLLIPILLAFLIFGVVLQGVWLPFVAALAGLFMFVTGVILQFKWGRLRYLARFPGNRWTVLRMDQQTRLRLLGLSGSFIGFLLFVGALHEVLRLMGLAD